MQRRTFLTLSGGLLAGAALQSVLPPARAATFTRGQAWAPNSASNLALEWRYIAGRVTNAPNDDYGFIISISDQKLPSAKQELLVQKQDFNGGAPLSDSYAGSLSYAPGTGSYTFQGAGNSASAVFQLDPNTQLYHITLSSPNLSFADMVLHPQGALIPEAGDGLISIGTGLGFPIDSDYYADWTVVELGGQARGVARVDMQGLRLVGLPSGGSADYDHHWFALAGTVENAPIWITAWRIETAGGPLWDVTIAKGASPWLLSFKTEADAMIQPLTVRPLAGQPTPVLAGAPGPHTTGTSWHISAGAAQPGDLLDLTISVPPGQFAQGARIGATGTTSFLEEGVGFSASGTVQGKPFSSPRLVVAETTAEFAFDYLPLLRR